MISPPARGCTKTFMRFWYGCMNEMLLPSGETWKPDRSGFLKKSRKGMSFVRLEAVVVGGIVEWFPVKLELCSRSAERGDTTEI
jgi:hypothetical protein